MKKIKIIPAIAILFLFTLACNALSPAAQPSPTQAVIVEPTSPPTESNLPLTEVDVPRVTVEEAKAAFDEGTAVIVDVRSQAAYEASHVDGALSIPLNEFETNIAGINLPKDEWIITYCT